MQSICKQPEDTFIKMALFEIDFYFEVFNQTEKPCFDKKPLYDITIKPKTLLDYLI